MVEMIQTEKQKEAALLPTRLEVLREYEKRHALDHKYKVELRNLEAGEIGEQIVLKYLETYGEPHWKAIKNLWLDYHSTFECDLLLITNADWYTIEIKHYTGEYELKNHQWSCNGIDRAHNPVSQAKKVVIHFQNMARENKVFVPIKGSLVFTGTHFSLRVEDEVNDLDIITANQLRNFIFDIARDERNSFHQQTGIEKGLKMLEKYEVTNPFPAEDLSKELGEKLQKGIMCCQCSSFDVQTNSSYVTCSCGMHEPKEIAIVRTICEYGVIHFNKDFTANEMTAFFNGAYTRQTLAKFLNKYFERYGTGRSTRYKRVSRPLPIVFEQFPFEREYKFHFKNLNEWVARQTTKYNNRDNFQP